MNQVTEWTSEWGRINITLTLDI